MSELIKSLSVLTFVVLLATNPVAAQETGTTSQEPASTEEPADEDTKPEEEAQGIDLELGQDVSAENEIGRTYTKETHGDWQIRCIRSPEGDDPCQLYQLLKDSNDNSVAEINMFALSQGQQAVAGATIVAPLETLLTEQMTLAVDGGQARRYPFSWCSAGGCFARIGLSAGDIASFKRGSKATMTIVPAGAPNTKVVLTISLSGFTAGFDAIAALGPRAE